MEHPLPYLVRTIDPNITVTDDILQRELEAGCAMMTLKMKELQKFVYEDSFQFSWHYSRKDEHTIEWYMEIHTPNEEGSFY